MAVIHQYDGVNLKNGFGIRLLLPGRATQSSADVMLLLMQLGDRSIRLVLHLISKTKDFGVRQLHCVDLGQTGLGVDSILAI